MRAHPRWDQCWPWVPRTRQLRPQGSWGSGGSRVAGRYPGQGSFLVSSCFILEDSEEESEFCAIF